jgi:hypothetical protein
MRIHDLFLSLTCCGMLAATAIAQPPAGQETKPKPPEAAKPSQTSASAPESLEATIADALKCNPKIQSALAELREAEIKLNETRNSVMVLVASQYRVLAKAKETFKTAEEIYNGKLEMYRRNKSFSMLELMQEKLQMDKAASSLAECEAELMKTVGRVPGLAALGSGTGVGSAPGTAVVQDSLMAQLRSQLNFNTSSLVLPANSTIVWDNRSALSQFANVALAPPAIPPNSMMDKLKAALDRPVKIDKELKGVPARQALDYLREHGMDGIPMRVTSGNSFNVPIDLMAGELPLRAWLQAMQDSVPDLQLVVREYGLLVTTSERVPTDGILLGDFLRRIKASDVKAEEELRKKKATEPAPGKPRG